MSNIFDLVKRYPWLPSLKKYSYIDSKDDPYEYLLELFSKYPNGEIQERVFKFFRAAFENIEYLSGHKNDDLNIYLYLILRILLYILDNKPISNRIANLYSKITNNELLKEADATVYEICQDLNLKIKYYQPPINYGINISKDQKQILETNFRIHYADYLKLAANLRDEYRKLVNNALSEGYVFIQKRSLIRLIQEYVRRKFLNNEDDEGKSSNKFKKNLLKIQEFKEIYDNILSHWELKKEEFEYNFEISFKKGSNISKDFPPCIKDILLKAEEGQNLTHIERLFITFFLNALDYPEDEIINVFSTMPDFDKKKTEYQINFAKRKGYIPHSCATLKSLNLCMAVKYNDQICLEGYFSKKLDTKKTLAHPLFYIQLKQYRGSKKIKKLED